MTSESMKYERWVIILFQNINFTHAHAALGIIN